MQATGSRDAGSRFPISGAERRASRRLVKIKIAAWPRNRLVFRFPEGFLEFAIQKVGLGFLRLGALLEKLLAPGLLFFEQLARLLEVAALRASGRKLMADHLPKGRINFQVGAA